MSLLVIFHLSSLSIIVDPRTNECLLTYDIKYPKFNVFYRSQISHFSISVTLLDGWAKRLSVKSGFQPYARNAHNVPVRNATQGKLLASNFYAAQGPKLGLKHCVACVA